LVPEGFLGRAALDANFYYQLMPERRISLSIPSQALTTSGGGDGHNEHSWSLELH
jgi:hypothetical protein